MRRLLSIFWLDVFLELRIRLEMDAASATLLVPAASYMDSNG